MIFSLFTSFVSFAVSAVSSAISVVGSFVASVGKIVLNSISAISTMVGKIAEGLDLLPKNTNMETLGDQALQAADAGIKPENYDSNQAYIDAITQFKIDPEKSKNYTPEQKYLAATGITVKSVEEKFNLKEGSMGDLLTLAALDMRNGGSYFNEDRITKILKSGMDIDKVSRFFEGELGLSDMKAARKELIAIEQEISPEKTDVEIATDLETLTEELKNAADNELSKAENNLA